MTRGNWTDDPCYYVTVIDGPRVGWLAGPYPEHRRALDAVDKVRRMADARDPWSCFYGFGTAKRENGYLESLFGEVTP